MQAYGGLGTVSSDTRDEYVVRDRGVQESVDSVYFHSSMVEAINILRGEVAALCSEVREIKELGPQQKSTSPGSYCLLYVQFQEKSRLSGFQIGKSTLEYLLGCSVLQYLCLQELPNPPFRVKIAEGDLQKAMDCGHRQGCFVDLWHNPVVDSGGSRICNSIRDECSVRMTRTQGLQMTCWNCRGIARSQPYLETLMQSGSRVMVLSELWL